MATKPSKSVTTDKQAIGSSAYSYTPLDAGDAPTSGNDILVGGAGDDILVGGAGSDTFKYAAGDLTGVVNGDTIMDFKVDTAANGGDILDLRDLLGGSGATLDNLVSGGFLNFDSVTHNADGTTTVKLGIDMNGNADGQNYVPLATITMSGLVSDNPVDILNKLLANSEIKL